MSQIHIFQFLMAHGDDKVPLINQSLQVIKMRQSLKFGAILNKIKILVIISNMKLL